MIKNKDFINYFGIMKGTEVFSFCSIPRTKGTVMANQMLTYFIIWNSIKTKTDYCHFFTFLVESPNLYLVSISPIFIPTYNTNIDHPNSIQRNKNQKPQSIISSHFPQNSEDYHRPIV